MSELGFVLDLIVLSTTFILIIKYREKISDLFRKIPLPIFLVYLISSVPFIIFEENINCLSTGCVLIPWTVPFLVGFVLILGAITLVLKPKTILPPLIGFAIFGILWEAIIGGLAGQLPIIGLPFYIFMILWTGMGYMYLVIVPLTILLHKGTNSPPVQKH